jgi:hypothetical protein
MLKDVNEWQRLVIESARNEESLHRFEHLFIVYTQHSRVLKHYCLSDIADANRPQSIRTALNAFRIAEQHHTSAVIHQGKTCRSPMDSYSVWRMSAALQQNAPTGYQTIAARFARRNTHWMLSMHQTVPDVARGIKVVMQRVLARMVACWITRYRAAYLRLALRLTCTLLIAYHPVHPSAHVSRSSSVPASACARAGAACITP